MKLTRTALLFGALLIGNSHAQQPPTANAPVVETVGEAPAEAAALVSAYERVHDAVTPEGVDAIFAPGFEVFGFSTTTPLPPGGLQRDAYIKFLGTLRGTTFRQQPGTKLLLTKDGRVVMHWTLKAGERPLAAGVDYITIENGRIRKIVGYF